MQRGAVTPIPLRPATAAPVDRSAYLTFDRREWAALRSNTPMSLSRDDLENLRGVNDPVSLNEVADIYLPLSRLLNLHVMAARSLKKVVQDAFLGRPTKPAPYIIGVAGSVAVGKSTFARLLRAAMARWPDHPRVALVTTDGFLHPTKVLLERNLMRRKGFPESYDQRSMLKFLAAVKSGTTPPQVPVYSHLSYDIVQGQFQTIERPDVLIFEGLNVLQHVAGATVLASDFFDFSVYIDAATADAEAWYVERFLLLQRTAFQNPASYFHHYKDLDRTQAEEVARGIWRDINRPNLEENILPTRERARLVLRKDSDHKVEEVWLRRV